MRRGTVDHHHAFIRGKSLQTIGRNLHDQRTKRTEFERERAFNRSTDRRDRIDGVIDGDVIVKEDFQSREGKTARCSAIGGALQLRIDIERRKCAHARIGIVERRIRADANEVATFRKRALNLHALRSQRRAFAFAQNMLRLEDVVMRNGARIALTLGREERERKQRCCEDDRPHPRIVSGKPR